MPKMRSIVAGWVSVYGFVLKLAPLIVPVAFAAPPILPAEPGRTIPVPLIAA